MKGETILALLAGTAIGVGIGLLIAPNKGEDTRKKIKKIILDSCEDIKNNAQATRDTAEEKLSEICEKLTE